MYAYMHDSQTEVGNFCLICGCEFSGDGDICQRCQERLDTYED